MRQRESWLAVVIASVGLLVGPASAPAVTVDAGQDTVVCNTISGRTSFKPALLVGGTATSEEVLVKGSLDGCVATGPTPVTIQPGSKFVGTFTSSTNDCVALITSQTPTGSLTIKWKSSPGLTETKSVVTPAAIQGVVYSSDPWGADYPALLIGGPGTTVTGSFAGTDGGDSSLLTIVASESFDAMVNACLTPTGLKLMHIGLGNLTLQ
jgi:hypothetical protein